MGPSVNIAEEGRWTLNTESNLSDWYSPCLRSFSSEYGPRLCLPWFHWLRGQKTFWVLQEEGLQHLWCLQCQRMPLVKNSSDVNLSRWHFRLRNYCLFASIMLAPRYLDCAETWVRSRKSDYGKKLRRGDSSCAKWINEMLTQVQILDMLEDRWVSGHFKFLGPLLSPEGRLICLCMLCNC